MLRITKTICVDRNPYDCFTYLADLRKLVEWDSNVVSASKRTQGPVAKGSCFTVGVNLGGIRIPFTYVITEFRPSDRLVMTGRSLLFNVNDSITFTESERGVEISYCIDFYFKFGLSKFFTRRRDAFEQQCQSAIDHLKSALEQAPCEATLSPESARADKKSLSTLKTFTRLGYSSSRKAWQPVTERMEGLHVVLTGANSGIGLAAAIDLAVAGADLTLVVRSPEKADATLRVLSDETGRTDFKVELADLSLINATDSLARRLLEHGRPIDVLINNAGALFNQHSVTQEGLERSYALLLLSPWRLTEALMPLLSHHKKPSRVINVVSGGMYAERLNLQRLNVASDGYRGARAYAQCKRALNTLTEIWASRWAEHNIVVNAMHPGWSDTPGVQTALPLFRIITRLVLRSHREGADTVVWMARSDQAGLSSGKLFLDRQPRSPYLLGNNVEAPEQRTALEARLSEDHLKALNRSANA